FLHQRPQGLQIGAVAIAQHNVIEPCEIQHLVFDNENGLDHLQDILGQVGDVQHQGLRLHLSRPAEQEQNKQPRALHRVTSFGIVQEPRSTATGPQPMARATLLSTSAQPSNSPTSVNMSTTSPMPPSVQSSSGAR